LRLIGCHRAFVRKKTGLVVSFCLVKRGVFHATPPNGVGENVQFDQDDEGTAPALPEDLALVQIGSVSYFGAARVASAVNMRRIFQTALDTRFFPLKSFCS
jgi:hypothetical protein